MIIKGMCTLCNFFLLQTSIFENVIIYVQIYISVYESVTNNQNYMLIRELYFLRSDSSFGWYARVLHYILASHDSGLN